MSRTQLPPPSGAKKRGALPKLGMTVLVAATLTLAAEHETKRCPRTSGVHLTPVVPADLIDPVETGSQGIASGEGRDRL